MSFLALSLAFASALCCSGANLAIGPACRRAGAWTALVAVLAIGAASMAAVALALEGAPGALGPRGAWSLAGAIGAAALAYCGLFLALERGQVSVVAPIAAAWCVVSAAIGLLRGEAITPLGAAGIAAVVLGNGLLAAAPPVGGSDRRGGALAAAVSALGFGLLAPCMADLGAELGRAWAPPAIFGGLALALAPPLLAARRLRPQRISARSFGLLAATALLESAGFVALSLALGRGALAQVTPVASLATGLSVALGLVLLRERLRKRALLGAIAASVGVVLVQL